MRNHTKDEVTIISVGEWEEGIPITLADRPGTLHEWRESRDGKLWRRTVRISYKERAGDF